MRDNILYQKHRNRYLRKVKPLTLIIGMYYANQKGAVIVSDSRLVKGPDYTTDQKLFKITKDAAFSTSGLSGIGFELLENVKERMTNDGCDVIALKKVMEEEALKLCYRYKASDMPAFGKDETLFDGILGGFHNGEPRLYHLAEPGYMEPMMRSDSVGDGSRHATQIIETLHEPSISKERAIEIAVHAIIQTSRLDTVVDANPQIAVFEKRECTILNYSENGTFLFNKPEILAIKNKINGIAEKQSKVFNLMLDGSEELKKKFVSLLDEYERIKK